MAYLINDKDFKSSTIKSYISAIKRTLIDDGYKWQDDKIMVTMLTRACRVINDYVRTRLPIQCRLLEQILFEISRLFTSGMNNQPYLECLFQALFLLGYYGLMKIGELTQSQHVVRAKNLHLARNKEKLLIILYTSKTHDKSSHPQRIKITLNKTEQSGQYIKRHFCPFLVLRKYLAMRGPYIREDKQFFVFSDHSPVTANVMRALLKKVLRNLGIDASLYGMHSLRIGRTMDLIKYGYSLDEVKWMGRWKSTCVLKYIC